MYNNILVAFDDSEFSKAALMTAWNWVKIHQGKIFLVHAVHADFEELDSTPGQKEKRFKLGKEACYRTTETVASQFGSDIESFVCEGEPHEVIVDIAKAQHADLIAMGTHGRKGLKKMFVGSVASRVIASSPCDVLVVKKPFGEAAGKRKSILLCYDGSELSKHALTRVCALSKVEAMEITALYVIPRIDEITGLFPTDLIKKRLFQEAQKTVQEAAALASQQGVSIKTEIAEGDAAENIILTGAKLGSDMIVSGTHGWKGLDRAIIGSVIENIIVNVSCPVLVVK
jgi:nucleotide-binding universal stress UspA family protein